MKHAVTMTLSAAGLVLAACQAAPADSIWQKGRPRTQHLAADDTARAVGDQIQIVISERTKIARKTSSELEKKSTRKAKIDGTLDLRNLIGAVGEHIFDFPKLDVAGEASSDFDGSAKYDSDRSVVDQIAVTVKDVLPNGNLVVQGRRERTVGGDRQVIQVSGIVRPSDVTHDNKVNSDQVANFTLVYAKQGRSEPFTRPGWLGQILNFLSPF